MKRLKAAEPATATTVNRLHARVSAWRQKLRDVPKTFDPTTQPGFLSVYAGQTCLGHLLSRGKLGVEAYNISDISLGIFPDQKSAADALSKAADPTLMQQELNGRSQ